MVALLVFKTIKSQYYEIIFAVSQYSVVTVRFDTQLVVQFIIFESAGKARLSSQNTLNLRSFRAPPDPQAALREGGRFAARGGGGNGRGWGRDRIGDGRDMRGGRGGKGYDGEGIGGRWGRMWRAREGRRKALSVPPHFLSSSAAPGKKRGVAVGRDSYDQRDVWIEV